MKNPSITIAGFMALICAGILILSDSGLWAQDGRRSPTVTSRTVQETEFNVFRTKELSRSRNVDIEFSYPKAWIAGKLDDIDQNTYALTFRGSEKKSRHWLTFVCAECPVLNGKAWPKEETEHPNDASSNMKDGEKVISTKLIDLKGVRAKAVEKIYPCVTANKKILIAENALTFWDGPYSINITLTATGLSGEKELIVYMDSLKPVFQKLIHSIEISDIAQYEPITKIELAYSLHKSTIRVVSTVLLVLVLVPLGIRCLFSWLNDKKTGS